MFPVLKDEDMQNIEIELSETVKGEKFDSLIIETTIMSNICYRKFDNLYRMLSRKPTHFSRWMNAKCIDLLIISKYIVW